MNQTELSEFFTDNFASFSQADIDNVKEVIYDDAWHSHEETSGLFIYRAQDNLLYSVEYRYFSVDKQDKFVPIAITEDESVIKIFEKEEEISDFYEPKNGQSDDDDDDFPFY